VTGINMQTAVFRKVHEPLTKFDKPRRCGVLVRTATTGVCHSDLHVTGPDTLWPK